jgi:hypothetical protein
VLAHPSPDASVGSGSVWAESSLLQLLRRALEDSNSALDVSREKDSLTPCGYKALSAE